MENLVNLDICRRTGYLNPAFDCFEGKIDLRLFEPGHEAEGGG